MSHYVSGRQFIFEERPRWIFLGLLVVMLIGMLIGILLGLIISLAGIYLFEALTDTYGSPNLQVTARGSK
ncbi:hypothetical protein AK812_SmicGene43746, partial [Symbiodinium microadriaticum]